MPDTTGVNRLWDELFGAVGRAVADIREKVVLEPWFGGAARTEPLDAMHRSVAEELGWVSPEGSPAKRPMTYLEFDYSLGVAHERQWGRSMMDHLGDSEPADAANFDYGMDR